MVRGATIRSGFSGGSGAGVVEVGETAEVENQVNEEFEGDEGEAAEPPEMRPVPTRGAGGGAEGLVGQVHCGHEEAAAQEPSGDSGGDLDVARGGEAGAGVVEEEELDEVAAEGGPE